MTATTRILHSILWDTHISAVPGGKKALAAKKKMDKRIIKLIKRLALNSDDKHCNRMLKRLKREQALSKS